MTLIVTNQEASSLTPSTLITLITVDCTVNGGQIYNFYDGTANNYQPLTFNGVVYDAFPFKLEGFDIDGKGSLPRPKITLANIKGFVSSLILRYDNIIGARFIRTRVYARFLDSSNFPNNINPYGTPDPTAAYPDEIFFVNRKITENSQIVQFEIVTPLELDNAKLPKRQIFANICFFDYRDESCGYNGPPIADKNNKVFGAGGYGLTLVNRGEWNSSNTYNSGDYVYIISILPLTEGNKVYFVCSSNGVSGEANHPTRTSLWVADSCPRSFKGCKYRFPSPLPLNFGGFLGTSKTQIIIS